MQTQAIVVAIFSLCGVFLGGALQYMFGRALESRKQLTLQRSQSYIDYFRAVALIAQNGKSKENLSMAADAKVRICIYGSANAIKYLSDFEASGANTSSSDGQFTLIGLLKEMRKDIEKDFGTVNSNDLQHILFGSVPKTDN